MITYYDEDGMHDGKYVWFAELANGERIYQDDQPETTWDRLREYLQEKNTYIVNVGVKLSQNEQRPFEPNQEGYYCSRGVLAFLTGAQTHTLVIGYVKNGQLYTHTYKCPELLILEDDKRDITTEEIIWRNHEISLGT
jgi:hypothetical protein